MTAHNDLDRQLTDFLRDGPEELPYESFDAVRDRTEQTGQRVVLGPWRLPEMNKTVTIALGAAAVVIVAVVGASVLAGRGDGIGSGPPASTTPTATPQPASPSPSGSPSSAAPGSLAAGETFTLSLPTYPRDINVTIPAAGWYGTAGDGFVTKRDGDPPDGAGVIAYLDPGYFVYGDPCRWLTTRPETPATTVDEVVAALSTQALRDASEPVDVTVGGYTGKLMTLHVPPDADFSECDREQFASWGVPAEDPARYHQGAGQIDKLWILDVDGSVAILDAAYFEPTPQSDRDELDAIVESASFE